MSALPASCPPTVVDAPAFVDAPAVVHAPAFVDAPAVVVDLDAARTDAAEQRDRLRREALLWLRDLAAGP